MNLTKLSVLLATAAFVAAAPASADKPSGKGPSGTAPSTTKKPAKKPSGPIADCAADGDLDRVYSPGTLQRALRRLPADIGTYTYCPDVLRFARTAGPVLPVTRRFARFRARCTGADYEVTISVGDKLLGTATVKKCRRARGSRIVRIPVGTLGTKKAAKGALATIVAKPGDETLQFVARLAGRRRF